MNAAIEERLKVAGSDHWIEKLNTAGVPCDRLLLAFPAIESRWRA